MPTDDHVRQVIDHLFRRESAKMVSALVRIFGIGFLETAEDVVQESLIQALKVWPFQGIPENPAGWLHRVAKNRALDIVRREKLKKSKTDLISREDNGMDAIALDLRFQDAALKDDQLRMIFTSCHPSLPEDAQVALTLKTLCGFSIQEIARAFFTNEETITKRLYRARQKLREENIRFEMPNDAEMEERLQAVLKVIYLLFNEGYNSGHPDKLIREDLCAEAMRLCYFLLESPACNKPETNALMALMCFNAARFDARVDDKGSIILLKEQDRSLWDEELINRGSAYLNNASTGEELSAYHVEAGISMTHAMSPSFEETNWEHILHLYNLLWSYKPSPVILLNRAVVISMLEGPEKALEEMEKIEGLETYYLYHATLGELYLKMGLFYQAAQSFKNAIALATSGAEKELLQAKLDLCKPGEN